MSEEDEKRYSDDGKPYTLAEFIKFGGEEDGKRCWDHASPEKRISDDGKAYTLKEFIGFVGEEDGRWFFKNAKPTSAPEKKADMAAAEAKGGAKAGSTGKGAGGAPPANPSDLFEEINARRRDYEDEPKDDSKPSGSRTGLATVGTGIVPPSQEHVQMNEAVDPTPPAQAPKPSKGPGKGPPGKKGKGKDSIDPSHPQCFKYSEDLEAFLFKTPSEDSNAHEAYTDKGSGGQAIVIVPLAPCIYRLTDYTLAKKEPIALHRCVLKLGVLRSLHRECVSINALLWGSLSGEGPQLDIDEDTLGATRFMELISSCGLFQKVSELVVTAANSCTPGLKEIIPKIVVQDLDDFLSSIESLNPSLKQARGEIEKSQTVSFFPGLGELFSPGAQVLARPDGMDGSPLGCGCVQSYYTEELNKATGKLKRQFVIVLEFIVSLGDKLVFIAASDVYPEFNDPNRNAPIKDLKHKKLFPHLNKDEEALLESLKARGKFYASVATQNHFLQYQPNSFFPIIAGGGWNSNAMKPLSKGGRVMVDVKRGMLEGHAAVRGADGMSDSVKEAFKLYDQSKKTGTAMPFREVKMPSSDTELLWSTWPMLVGFSFASRCWGKLVLGVPDLKSSSGVKGLNCDHIQFREKAFDQLVLPDDKKELIRAVARNASGGDDDDGGVDVVANKGAASIFLLYGPPGCGKTLTAEAIAELLQKPLYVVTAGDLGVTASEVEKSLGAVLELCQTWDSLVLLDEADIFLEARSSSEIQRNALVCVMLRLLEYYSGCLFLASNRVGNIDPAIASRITVMLGYPALDSTGREKVWKNLIGNLPKEASSGVTEKDYKDLSERVLNGRQIKSAIVLARSLAKERKETLGLAVLKRAVDAVAGEREAAEERLQRLSTCRTGSLDLSPTALRQLSNDVEPSFAPH